MSSPAERAERAIAQATATDTECASCGQDGNPDATPRNECPKSQRPCGHHCNHSWTHDVCHWCGKEWGEE